METCTASEGNELNNKFIDSLVSEDTECGDKKRTKDKNSKSLLLKQRQIVRIGDVSDYSQLRKLSISFNALRSLKGLDQLPHLRYLAAYCCGVTDFEDLSENKRLEKLYLQQNLIQELPFCLRGLQKLQHLRVDRNRVACIENLQACTSLKSLDLSSNKLESLEGLAGMQSLRELKVNFNFITSLKPLHALPSLKEIQIDSNRLSSLEGIQCLPTLETLHANDNAITAFKIPQTYTYMGSVEKGSGGGSIAFASPAAAAAANAAFSSSSASSSSSSSKRSHVVNTKLGMANLMDVFLANNQLQNLEGIEKLGDAVQCIDLTGNKLFDLDSTIKQLEHLSDLRDLRVKKNAFLQPKRLQHEHHSLSTHSDDMLSESTVRKTLLKSLLPNSPMLEEIDGMSVQSIVEKLDDNRLRNELNESIFKTWGYREDFVLDETDPDVDIYIDSSESERDSDDENNNLEARKVLSQKEIEEIEVVFTGLVASTRDLLKSIAEKFDAGVLATKTISNLKRSKPPQSKSFLVTNDIQSEVLENHENESMLLTKQVHSAKLTGDHVPDEVNKDVNQLRSSVVFSSTDVKQALSCESMSYRPHSANESLRSPLPDTSDSAAVTNTRKLKSFSILDMRNVNEISGDLWPLGTSLPLSARSSGDQKIKGMTSRDTTNSNLQRNKYEIPGDLSPNKNVITRANVVDLYHPSRTGSSFSADTSRNNGMKGPSRKFKIPSSARAEILKQL